MRNGDNNETTEWYSSGAIKRGSGYTQGLWQLSGQGQERTFYNIAGKPVTQGVKRSGKQGNPNENYALPSILEVITTGLQEGDDPQLWARAVDQCRTMGYTTLDMTLLPLPLHWAYKLKSYAEAIGLWVFPEDWENEIEKDQPDDFDADSEDLDADN